MWLLFRSGFSALRPKIKHFRIIYIHKKCYFPVKFVGSLIIFVSDCSYHMTSAIQVKPCHSYNFVKKKLHLLRKSQFLLRIILLIKLLSVVSHLFELALIRSNFCFPWFILKQLFKIFLIIRTCSYSKFRLFEVISFSLWPKNSQLFEVLQKSTHFYRY